MKYSTSNPAVGALCLAVLFSCGGKSGDAPETSNGGPSTEDAGPSENPRDGSALATEHDAGGGTQNATAFQPTPSADGGATSELDASVAIDPVTDISPTGADASAAPTDVPTAPPATTSSNVPTTTPPVTTPPLDPGPPPPSFDWSVLVAPDGCELEEEFGTDADTCAFSLVCDGIKQAQVHCELDGCYCQDDSAAWPVSLEGEDLVQVCQAGLDFCQPPTKDEATNTACVPTHGTADATSCSTARQCDRTQHYDSGVVGTMHTVESVDCGFDSGSVAGQAGQWHCMCVREGVNTGEFFTPGATPSLDTCRGVQDICLRYHALLPGKGTTCEASFETFNDSSCNSTSKCLVAGNVDGALVHVNDDLFVNCYLSTDVDMACAVDGPLGSVEVIVPKPDTTLDACRAVAADVVAQIEAQVPPDEPSEVDGGIVAVPDAG